MFFSSVLVPSSVLPAGRTETLASQRSEPSSMFTSLTPSWRSVTRSRFEPVARLLGRVDVGLGDDLAQRRAAAVVVDDRGVGAVDPARLADVDELRRVLLEVDPVQPHVAQPAARGRSGCRTGRSGSSWPGRDRSSSCGGRSTAARSRSPSARPIISAKCTACALTTGSVPGRPRQTGQVRVFGGSPKLSSQPQNIFVRVSSWTWISRPMTGSQLGHRGCLHGASRKSIAALERVGGVEQRVLAERRAGELEADRQPLAQPARDRDRRGCPASDIGTVQKSFRYIASGSSVFAPSSNATRRRRRRGDEVEALPGGVEVAR